MKKSLLLLLILVMGCQKQSELSFVDLSFKFQSEIVLEEKNATDVHFIVPYCQQNSDFCNVVNLFFLQKIKEILEVDVSDKKYSYQELGKQFVRKYERYHNISPANMSPWEAKIQGEVEQVGSVLNTYFSYYIFSGGTNLQQGVISGFFDKSSQKEINLKDLFVNFVQFKKIVQIQFQAQYDNESLEEFVFEDNSFSLAKNHYIKDGYWIVSYASGEIAPSYKGMYEIKIPLKTIQPLLNPMYF